ncbi:hypothetical protein TNCV_3016211 [Trichonephila clavipes]|nr:hypothetical protein TNCV_3016211 [Trichonephila clavipes]
MQSAGYIQRVQCIGAGGCHPFWHGRRAKAGNSLGSLQVPRDWVHSGQSFSWLSKTLRFLGSIFVNVCGDDALCSSEGQGDLQLSRLRSLLAFSSALSLPNKGSLHDLVPTIRPQSSRMR